jgi:glycosyl transferase family 25
MLDGWTIVSNAIDGLNTYPRSDRRNEAGWAVQIDHRTFLLTLKRHDDDDLCKKVRIISSALGSVEVCGGIDGAAQTCSEYFSQFVYNYSRNRQILPPGQVGCSLSHLKIIEAFLSGTSRIGIIFEDDVEIHSTSFDMLRTGLNFVGPCDILVAGCQEGLEYLGPLFGSPVLDSQVFEVHKSSWTTIKRACAYAVGRRAAEHIRDTQRHALWASDDFRVLGHPDGRILFCKAFSHPLDLTSSRIEAGRNVVSRVPPPKPLIKRIKEEIYASLAPRGRRFSQAILVKTGVIRRIEK